MTTNDLLFGALPYAAIALVIFVTIARWRLHQFHQHTLAGDRNLRIRFGMQEADIEAGRALAEPLREDHRR